jgi:ribonuclease BN (tRNA processing enzyme)
VLIDVGPSVVRRLLELGYTPDEIDVIILTHFHPDHTVDLATFLFACNYGERERQKPLTILGGRGINAFYRRFSRLFPWIEAKGYVTTVKGLPSGRWNMGNLFVVTQPVEHRAESIAIRVEERGKTAVFSGDTAYSPAFPDFAAGADILILECTSPIKKEEGHLNLADARRIARKARPGQTILTHLSPEWETFDHPIPRPLLLGEDGMEIEL